MKKRNLINIVAEISAWVVFGLLLYGLFKVVDPIKRYNITWFDKKEEVQVEQPLVEKTEKEEIVKNEVKDRPVQSTSRFKVEWLPKDITGGYNGLYLVTDKATGQQYIGLNTNSLTPLK